MRMSGRLALLGLFALTSCLLSAAGVYDRAEELSRARLEAGRMKNVVILEGAVREEQVPGETAAAEPASAPLETPPGEALSEQETLEAAPEILSSVMESSPDADIRETTIPGGLFLKNATGYPVDVEQMLRDGPMVRLPAEGPQILIIHTHGSEAYTPAGLDRYESNDASRTEDLRCNVIRVGDELAELLEGQGLNVLHDREIYDYPSYTGSYSRSGEAVQRYLEAYPDIAVVIDLHRDALGADGVVYKTMAEEEGTVASQIMLLVGTDDSGLEHPNWRSNLSLALYLQNAIDQAHPTLMRPVSLVRERYNQHLTGGSLILEVGSSGNTLQEALAAIRLFADAAGPALRELVQIPEPVTEP